VNDPTINPILNRRQILTGAAVLGAGLIAAACGSSTTSANTTGNTQAATTDASQTTTPATTGGSTPAPSVDLKVAALAASLEVLAVGTYKAALDAAGAGKLGTVPAAVGEFVTVAMGQHQQHLDKWNSVLTGAGAPAVTEPNATLKPVVDAAFGKVTDVTGAATLALMLEQIASATYLNAQNVLTDKDAIQLAGSIQIIDAQHAAVLLFVLGQYPVPDVFAKTDLAAAA
jgi:hypothetical protein